MYKYQEYYLAKTQVEEGHRVFVLTSDKNYPFSDYKNTSQIAFGDRNLMAGESLINDIRIIRLPILFEFRTRVLLKGLIPTIEKINPDIIIAHGLLNFNSIKILFSKQSCRLIFDEHMLVNQVDKSHFGLFIYFLYRIFVKKKLLKKAEKVVAISDGCILTLNRYFGIPIEKIKMIPLGADIKLFKFYPSSRRKIRTEFNFRDDDIVLIFTGKLKKSKGPHKIALALENIKTIKKIHVLLVGNGSEEYKTEIINLFANIHISCTIHPYVSSLDLPSFFSAADIAVYPGEATISTVEASSCSLPIICTNEIPERYRNFNGFGIEPGNISQLKRALELLINDDELRNKMRKNARVYVEKELSWEKISKDFLKI